ncbi:uncharacterized protein EKO05_0005665 [Ascochyta rabiei]|uniref:Uncharacterized protein n=1 Tax=Didymella rabiei TaxID=5454 RepID=A0A163MAY6_DIDRA|nr:uncharacterized protein EKO05_0005665 [Ascochyta rabiei]KZM28553.1 hypothetical protein ST47_g299 [Ascochyta rabiei]UPX15208.1 hypothetical protein EKO05_0005665 [Ascochyta rabiei]
MLRNGATRFARSITAPAARPFASAQRTAPAHQWTTQFGSLASKRPQTSQLARITLIKSSILRRNITKEQEKAEEKYAHEKLEPTPERVSTTSTIHPFLSEHGAPAPEPDVDMMKGVKSDLETIRETFSLKDVPREAYYMGLAGTIPYLGTSLATVLCAYEINHSVAGQGAILSEHSATQLLHLLEPIQIGYGASIISFLGAIHWGLEWAKYGGVHGYPRYAIGVFAPMAGWSATVMPIEYALITQFLSFVGLYFIDTRAALKGWTPPWYREYRFILTFIVGVSIVVTLIGRGEVSAKVGRMPGAVDRVKALREGSEYKLAEEEEARIAAKKDAAASDDRDKH